MRTRVVASMSVIGLLMAAPAWAQRCEYSREFDATVDAAGAVEALLVSEAGELVVEGVEGITEVRVRGTACASEQDRLDDMEVRARRSGDRVEVIAETGDSGWSRGGDYAHIDLEIDLPSWLSVEIDDGSGDIRLRGVASARIDDGSGDLEAEDVAGDLRIDDGSGDILVRGIDGEVRVDDGSGDIDVRGVGSVVVDDGSGGIQIRDVRGDVVIDDDGSGSIDVRRVGGDFIVRDDGSGGIRYEEIGGRVELPRDHRR